MRKIVLIPLVASMGFGVMLTRSVGAEAGRQISFETGTDQMDHPPAPLLLAQFSRPLLRTAPGFADAPAVDPAVQSRALEALREAESRPAAALPPAVVDEPAAETGSPSQALEGLRQADATPSSTASSADVTSQSRALEALRQREADDRMEDLRTRARAVEAARPRRPAEFDSAPPAPAPAVDPAVQSRALEALRREEAERHTPAPSQPEPSPVAAAPAPSDTVQRALEEVRRATEEMSATPEAPAPSDAVQRALEEVRRATEEMSATPEAPRADVRPEPVADELSGPSIVPAPVEMTERERRLFNLLRSYRADELTPTEYHRERARILAEDN